MNGINSVTIFGRLGADPEMATSKGGTSYCRLSIATNFSRKLPNGEREERTTWHKIKVFGKTADLCQTYLRKGSTALVEGYLSKNTFQREDGSGESTTVDVIGRQVTFIDRPKTTIAATDGEARVPF